MTMSPPTVIQSHPTPAVPSQISTSTLTPARGQQAVPPQPPLLVAQTSIPLLPTSSTAQKVVDRIPEGITMSSSAPPTGMHQTFHQPSFPPPPHITTQLTPTRSLTPLQPISQSSQQPTPQTAPVQMKALQQVVMQPVVYPAQHPVAGTQYAQYLAATKRTNAQPTQQMLQYQQHLMSQQHLQPRQQPLQQILLPQQPVSVRQQQISLPGQFQSAAAQPALPTIESLFESTNLLTPEDRNILQHFLAGHKGNHNVSHN